MGLVQVDTETVSAPVSSVTLTGIDSDDVYMVTVNNVTGATDGAFTKTRFTVSGTADSSSNYDYSAKEFNATTSFPNVSATNQNNFSFAGTGNSTSETTQINFYLFNFNNGSEYSFVTYEETTVDNNATLKGRQGGAVLTVAQACDGIQFFMSSGNIASGTFTLYKVV
jgi:hypothetical protein